MVVKQRRQKINTEGSDTMEKILFECDYGEGAHPKILERMTETNMEQTPGYGEDEHCRNAAAKIRALCENENAEVHFLVGGTQTNMTVISSILRPYQGVIAADTGHVSVHETGAIESTGHKVISVPGKDGKITAEQIRAVCEEHWADSSHEHIVQPGMVYISFPTEVGTLYSEKELLRISSVCREFRLPLFIDGARLGYGLASEKNDITLPRLASLCDVFYIGGTKVGALFGEAVVFTNTSLTRDFRYMIKQKGGMLAKGRLLGIQFETLLEDNLYFELAAHADRLAMKLRSALAEKGYPFMVESWTNQQFPILPLEKLEQLSGRFGFSFWGKTDETHAAVRFCTSWATKEEHVDALIAAL